jgi:hypothetical protein
MLWRDEFQKGSLNLKEAFQIIDEMCHTCKCDNLRCRDHRDDYECDLKVVIKILQS